jgi:hypothetical protein
MTVTTKKDGTETVVDQPNSTVNVTGSGNMTRSQDFFQTVGWDFNTVWEWDSVLNIPLPRR